MEDIDLIVKEVLCGDSKAAKRHRHYLLLLLLQEVSPERFLELRDRANRMTFLLDEESDSRSEVAIVRSLVAGAAGDLDMLREESLLRYPTLTDPETKESVSVMEAVERQGTLTTTPEVSMWAEVRAYLASLCGFDSWEEFVEYVQELRGGEDVTPILRRSVFRLIEGGKSERRQP
jgi:hypothetical protein